MQLRQVRDIRYRLLPGADRQTTDIVIERDGLISVRPPKRMTPEQVDAIVLRKRMWIYRNLADWRDLNATRVVREWVNGEAVPPAPTFIPSECLPRPAPPAWRRQCASVPCVP